MEKSIGDGIRKSMAVTSGGATFRYPMASDAVLSQNTSALICKMRTCLWFTYCLLVLAVHGVAGLEVMIEYSFRVPEQFGRATPKSANCCEFGRLPKNVTHGMVAPSIFGLGVQKGGTTTLYTHFQVHPQMIGAKKELHYLDTFNNESYIQYLRSWGYNKKGPKKQVVVKGTLVPYVRRPKFGGLFEISPSYMFVPFAACKAKIIAPHGKFIIFLRDPTSRAHSGLSYTAFVKRNTAGVQEWRSRDFWSLMRQGIMEVEQEPKCDFQTGKGKYDYNDCAGCMLRNLKALKYCGARPFITLKDEHGGYECNFVGKEHLLRGMYAPQLAWWFTLHDPSQFKIINSNKFFKHPLEVMKDIGDFLGLRPTYTRKMLRKTGKKSNVGHYSKEDPSMLAYANEVLTEFYRRPNLELYRLLEETGHVGFEPFEKGLQKIKLLNCSNPKIVEKGVCGDPRFHKSSPRYNPDAGRLPARVERAIHPVEPEDPKSDAVATMKATMTASAPYLEKGKPQDESGLLTNVEVGQNTTDRPTAFQDIKLTTDAVDFDADSQSTGEVVISDDTEMEQQILTSKDNLDGQSSEDEDSMKQNVTETEKETETETETESMEAFGTVPENLTEVEEEQHEKVETDLPSMAVHKEQISNVAEDETTSSDDIKPHLDIYFRSKGGTEQQRAQSGMITADHFVHFMYGVVFAVLIFYSYRWIRRRQRKEVHSHV